MTSGRMCEKKSSLDSNKKKWWEYVCFWHISPRYFYKKKFFFTYGLITFSTFPVAIFSPILRNVEILSIEIELLSIQNGTINNWELNKQQTNTWMSKYFVAFWILFCVRKKKLIKYITCIIFSLLIYRTHIIFKICILIRIAIVSTAMT